MPKPRVPTQEELNLMAKHLEVVGGDLVCRVPYGYGGYIVKKGKVLGYPSGGGYRRITFFRRVYLVHRVVYFLHTGSWPKRQIDHINGDGEDNRPENLREVSHGENARSFRKKGVGDASKFRGVFYDKKCSKWRAAIMKYRKKHSIGYYTCEKEAAMAYNYKAMELGFNKEAFNDVF